MAIPDMNARKLQLPWDDAGILGDIDGYLKIPRDIALTAAWLFGIGPDKTHVLKTDASGNLLVTLQGTPASTSELVDAAGNPLSSARSVQAVYNPLITGTYPVLLASHPLGAETATLQSPTFDARPYTTVTTFTVVTAVSGTTPSLTLLYETQDTNSGTWYTLNTGIAITAVTSNSADGTPIIAARTISAPATTTGRMHFPNYRISYIISGTTPSLTFAAYVVGA